MAATDTHAKMQYLLEALFSVRSVPKLYIYVCVCVCVKRAGCVERKYKRLKLGGGQAYDRSND
jgi:hypothetical protein